ncbi:hypothetical protein FS749_015236 [Ceratobasidium sp. UAMH 11750]|nr:hypothetical protein FS749_015236 [Ceratobasidium sp. UAMH 11750]
MSTKVAHISELVHNIALLCDSNTRIKLLSSCRSFFAFVAPLIWGNLEGAEKLLYLIEGISFDRPASPGVWRIRYLTLPKSLSDAHLKRFRLYAPMVRRLEIFSARLSDYTILNWRGLYDLSLSSPLLPNLLSLTAKNPMWFLERQHSQLPILLMFLSPSLVEYRIPYDNERPSHTITEPRFVAILSALQRHCPGLSTLELYCDDSLYSHGDELPLVPPDYALPMYLDSANLRSLSTNLLELKSAGDLRPISQVERLGIFSSENVQSFDELPSFQDVEWPKLRDLTLYLYSGIDTFFCIWQASSLVAGLSTFKLYTRNFQSPRMEHTVTRVATLLSEQSPKLTDVSFHPSPNQWLLNWLDPAPLVHVLSRLPVRNLLIHIGDQRSGYPRLSGRLSGQTFNSIRSINAAAYRVALEDLRSFAQSMPNLGYLCIQFWISGAEEGEVVPARSRSQALELCVSRVGRSVLNKEMGWEPASKYLLSLWLNMCFQLGPEVPAPYKQGWILGR